MSVLLLLYVRSEQCSKCFQSNFNAQIQKKHESNLTIQIVILFGTVELKEFQSAKHPVLKFPSKQRTKKKHSLIMKFHRVSSIHVKNEQTVLYNEFGLFIYSFQPHTHSHIDINSNNDGKKLSQSVLL